MFSVRQIAARQLLAKNHYSFALGGSKRKPTPSDLEKYDVVIVGAHLGNVLGTHLDEVVGEKQKIFCTFDNPLISLTSERGLYEQGHIAKFKYCSSTRPFMWKNNAHSDYVGVEKFNPDASEILLRNGRTIKYETLVVAMGMKDNYESIKGFEEAWADPYSDFHTNADHPSWKSSVTKPTRVHLNFNGGDAIFYIPPGNYQGEISDYNFLLSKDRFNLMAKSGKICWETSKFTVINPNKTFNKHVPRVDEFIRQTCADSNIGIEEDLILEEVKPSQNIAVFKNVNSGQVIERRFGHLYSLMPATTHRSLADAGLADSTGFLDVNSKTLQHTKYDNIFGLGDVNNVQTTKTFYGGVSQMHVVRKNLIRRLNGLPLNASYDGHAKASLPVSTSELITLEHNYNGEGLKFSTDKASMWFNNKLYTLRGKSNHENVLKFKGNDKHIYKWNKWFGKEDGGVARSSAPAELKPEKKAA